MVIFTDIHRMEPIVDKFGRSFKTLRVSLTNHCNLGCVYCVDDTAQPSDVPIVLQNSGLSPLSTSQYIKIIDQLHDSTLPYQNLKTMALIKFY